MSADIAERGRSWFVEMWGKRNRALVTEWMDPDVVGWSAGQKIVGREAWLQGV